MIDVPMPREAAVALTVGSESHEWRDSRFRAAARL